MASELTIAIISAVVAGLILDLLLRGNASIIIKAFKYLIGKFKRKSNRKQKEKLLLYLSAGGTCRDPMAKAITLKLIENRPLKFRLHVEGMALVSLSSEKVSYASQHVIKELYDGEDLLKGYVPQTVTQKWIDDADLILVMDHTLMNLNALATLPRTKTYVFKEFFGLKGDIVDPSPDGKDPETLSRYRKCATEIKSILENNIDDLLNALQT